ncbi:tumor necrosis factor receptor superfamily member 5-like isoform X1 [Toxotes jaculatrix]|uniref:tumor necrosis factor receptor superfamily member 5-like isoform X1 n=1 Tax=Toxotes jaculatrix TaxID=941984 RepID=UPI001B3AB7F6|nr:tumor necrosis factor receptor superfamily member 5-like isoform X1 [Toxotes jaculatrix]XP_040919295.1 tumor necrosis factor receptor superfamily member 5-like isoform X1 [Toxotes jaculatrix]XP_040919303.1 tumor necrosis factor receptor superfamily member 5-like isoform X1 [Toxotes jaculatrix]
MSFCLQVFSSCLGCYSPRPKSQSWCLHLLKTTNLPFKMTSTRKPVTAASLLILMIKVFSGNTLTCHPAEYQIQNECCPMCPPGSRVKTDCTEFRSTSCLPCMDGSFMNKPTGHKHCFPCAICDAGSGLKIKTSCTATSDTLCEPLEGFYCIDFTENHCVAAQKHSSCQPGQYIREKGTALRDTVCSDCSGGTFSDGTFPSCQPHTQCQSENLQLIRAGTASTDAECGPHSSHGAVIGASVGVVFILLICIISFVAWKKKPRLRGNKGNGSRQTEEKHSWSRKTTDS